ncbi:sigma-54-dependent Fis family transcriptional regulator [Bacillus sp. MM2020_1]|nr:sigma-54-dependent Fis family transcriptional regulator [Bacillus sp. MM2020_1]
MVRGGFRVTTTTFYLDTWKRFIKEGVLDPARLNKRIIESWYRCKNDKVNPYLNKGLRVLTSDLLSFQKDKHSLLMETALPHLSRMNQAIIESGMMALLVDPDGYVLSLTGNEQTLKDARNINFIEGVCWTENEVGTNAIGTALKTAESVIINGAEHYSVASHQWSCTATPILNEKGNLMGVIDVSCPVERSHPFMIGMVTSIAYAIERDISRVYRRNEINLVQHAVELVDTYRHRPFVVCDHGQRIISVSKAVREKHPHANGMELRDFLKKGYQIDIEKPILSKEDNSILGISVFLSEVVSYNQHSLFAAATPSQSFLFKGVRGTSEVFQNTLKQVELVASTDATVFITGETGTGKELIARAIHDNSLRKNGPFISLNCGAIPKDLMSSELFGYVEGAFTGAKRQGNKGKFELAHKGTIFLDEIGEIPEAMQVALLRLLQERKVVPIGGSKEIPLDIRIITATHRDMNELIDEGTFRQDLYYRLNVYPVEVPALRRRKEDIPYLVRYFCQKHNWNLPDTNRFLHKLSNYEWLGNVRELLNVLERLHIMFSSGLANQDTLIDYFEVIQEQSKSTEQVPIDGPERKLKAREKIQRDLMLDALQKTKGNVTAAAKLLDIPRSTFYKRIQKFGL